MRRITRWGQDVDLDLDPLELPSSPVEPNGSTKNALNASTSSSIKHHRHLGTPDLGTGSQGKMSEPSDEEAQEVSSNQISQSSESALTLCIATEGCPLAFYRKDRRRRITEKEPKCHASVHRITDRDGHDPNW